MEFVTKWCGWVWNNYCGSRTKLYAKTREELLQKIEEGQRQKIYGDIIAIDTVRVFDYETEHARVAEWHRLRNPAVSCPLPPAEDMLLIKAARLTRPEDYKTIEPNRAKLQETRAKLEAIQARKRAEHYANTP